MNIVPALTTPIQRQPLSVGRATEAVHIRNAHCGGYLYEAHQQVKFCNLGSLDARSRWLVEEFRGSFRIRNNETGNYITLEHQVPYVECSPVQDNWLSARWTFENVGEAGCLIRSGWRNWQLLHIEAMDGYVQYGGGLVTQVGAVWVLEG